MADDKNATQLIRYDAACLAIANAKTVDEVKQIRNSGAALAAYARIAKNKQLEADAAEIRIRAERRVGEMMAAQRATVGLAKAGRPKKIGTNPDPISAPPVAALADAGIDKHLADTARKLAAVPEQKFERMIGEWRQNVTEDKARATVDILKAHEREARQAEQFSGLRDQPFPDRGTYGVIYADPPWSYSNSGMEQSAAQQYPTMTTDAICALPVSAISGDRSVLFLWVTSPLLPDGLRVLSAWGFDYKASMVWIKNRAPGIGWFARTRHEFLLIGTRVSAHPIEKLDSVIEADVSVHSRKPMAAHDAIETMYPGVRSIELFARTARAGWDTWGNQPCA